MFDKELSLMTIALATQVHLRSEFDERKPRCLKRERQSMALTRAEPKP